MRFLRAFLLQIAALASLIGANLFAAPIEHPLGDGLRYLRPTELAADLPSSSASPRALVLDIRSINSASDEIAAAFTTWLQTHARPEAPLFVLVNAETAPALLRSLTQLADHPGLLTLGSRSDIFTPDVEISADSATEQTALQEIEKGAPLQRLIAEQAAKDRLDEASLMRERRDQNSDVEDSDAFDDLRDVPPSETTSPPVIDRTLQRAVQTHRALRALKRL